MKRHDKLVSDLCGEIDLLIRHLEKTQSEVKYWQDRYNNEICSSIKHSEKMMGNTLMAILNKDTKGEI